MLGGFRSIPKESLIVAHDISLHQWLICITARALNINNVATSVSKTFSGLPEHNRLRVVATYHFIGRWKGQACSYNFSVLEQLRNHHDRQMGFMKIGESAQNSHYVWTER